MALDKKTAREEQYWKSTARISVNIALIGISFTIFTLILTLKPELLTDQFLSLQLVLAIPFLISSTLARLRHVHAAQEKRWEKLGYGGFILAYTFLINATGILLASFESHLVVYLFFATNIALSLLYSAIEVSYNRSTLREDIFKNMIFVAIIIALGLIPSLAV